MTFVSDSPAYTHIECRRCPHTKTIPTWKLYSLFREKGLSEPDPKKMRCDRCGERSPKLTGRGMGKVRR